MGRGLRVCFVALLVLWVVSFPTGLRSVSSSVRVANVDRALVAPAQIVPTAANKPLAPGILFVGGLEQAIEVCDDAPLDGGAVMDGDTTFRSVAVPYCVLLRRTPDAEGLDYWLGQLGGGLSAVDVVDHLIASPEYQARGVRSFRASLAELTLSPDRIQERQQRAELAAAEQQKAEQARQAALLSDAEAAKRAAALRVRSEISDAEFEAWIAGRNVGDPDYVTAALVHMRRVADGQRINVAYVHLSATRGVKVSPGDRGRSSVGRYAAEIGAHVAVNGNWYSPYDGPAVSGGVVYGGEDHGYTALFGFTAEGDAVIQHHREINDSVDDRVVEGVSGHPTLVFRGETTTDFGNDPTFTARHPRTAIGLDQSGDVLVLVTVDGRSSTARGMTGSETAQLMSELGAYDAVMLDGGGSSTMWIAERGVVNQPSGSLRAVGNQIAAFGD
ncbi:MAG: phosphodiester glycosidase family protein [Acidimicrobiales bacterium]